MSMLWLLFITALIATATTTPTTTRHDDHDHDDHDAHDHCPLGDNGPDSLLNFFHEPETRPTMTAVGSNGCGSFGEGDLSCCTENYFQLASSKEDPFFSSALLLFPLSFIRSSRCGRAISEVSCGVCSSSQEGFVEDHSSVSELRMCLSFCETLLSSSCNNEILEILDVEDTEAGDVTVSEAYGGNAAGFCYDLFQNVENVKISVIKDDSSERQCFSTAPACTSEDFTSFYTECDPQETSRAVYFDYSDDSVCRGGESVPEPIVGLPCHQTCPAGEFLPIGARDCQKCQAGTHTIPGFYNELWKDWPQEWNEKNFATYCETHSGYTYQDGVKIVEGDCQGWMTNDTFIESGEFVDDSQQSVMELTTYLVTSGYVEFEYKVLSEPKYDGLWFIVDDVAVMTLQAQVLDWEKFRFELEAGEHSLKWIYFKDRVFSNSLDMAMIDKITITGTKWADTECDDCVFGHYSNEGAEFCSKCEMNTYSDDYGLAECLDCPESEYSGVGATHCLPRENCTDLDYTAAYGPCDGETRVVYYQMSQPILCNYADYELPPNETLACGDCNPGMYKPEGSNTCEYCPAGYHASETGAVGSCDACEPGTYARKAHQYTLFDSWDGLPLTTSCSGDCATDGWRLQFTSIDTGIGHGDVVDVVLEFVFSLSGRGMVEWYYSFECEKLCRFETVDVGAEWGGQKPHYASEFSSGSVVAGRHPIYFPGDHTFRWIFTKNADLGLGRPGDRLIIHNFTIYGVEDGGSISCETCPDGTYSDEAAEVCTECEPGQYSEKGALQCLPCPEGQFSSTKGASSCQDCGPNTVSFENRTGCDLNECTFELEIENDNNIVYNLSALEIPYGEDIYGPVLDQNDHIYYINPCTTKHNNKTCVDNNGVAFDTHACQKLGSPFDYYVDLGHVQGFLPLDDPKYGDDLPRSGLILTATGGEPGGGCGNLARSTNIIFLCNPNAGIGFPVGADPVEGPACFYTFHWASLYACPVCTMDDYVETYGQCSGGVQLLTYLPKTYPMRCHGGQGPPAPQTVPCETTKVDCNPGEYLPFLANDCVKVPAGHYSIGGGVVIETFVENLLSPVIDATSSWNFLGDFARSGAGDTYLKIDVFLVQAGYVEFEYKVVAPTLDPTFESGFTFSIDGESIFTIDRYTTHYRYKSFSIPLRSGDHTLIWKFSQGSVPNNFGRGNYAIIDYVVIFGTDRAARAPVPCKSGYFQAQEGQASCLACPTDTQSDAGSPFCTPCTEDHYSLPGSSDCEIRLPCEESDFVVKYSDCDENNNRIQYFVPFEPQTCRMDRTFFENENETTVSCPGCPDGYIFSEETGCTPCESGYIFESGSCVLCPAGSVPKLLRPYLPIEQQQEQQQEQQEQQGGVKREEGEVEEEEEEEEWWAGDSGDLPYGFVTYSTGDVGSTGWRVRNNSLDSGFHAKAEADSVLVLGATFVQQGKITFTYELQPQNDVEEEIDPYFLDGLEFFIDGELQSAVIYHLEDNTPTTVSMSIPHNQIEPKHHVFEWVFHQPSSSLRHNTIIISFLELFGDASGTAFVSQLCGPGSSAESGDVVCGPCQPGSYAPTPGQAACLACEDGYFSEVSGQSSCQECGKGTQSNSDATGCDLFGCVFTYNGGEREYDLSGLDPFIEFEDPDSTGYRYELSICSKIPPLMTNCFVGETPLNTFSCAKNKSTGSSFSTGTLASVGFTHDNPDPFPELFMRYDFGAPCRGANFFTEIQFVCDPNITSPSEGIEFNGQFECRTEVEWRNIAGCPLCQKSDYKEQITECVDSEQSVTWIKVNDCNGPEILKKETQTCHDYTLPIAVLSLGVFILLVFAIIVIVIRNNKLAERYEKLVHESTRRGSGPAEKPNAGWENDDDNEKL